MTAPTSDPTGLPPFGEYAAALTEPTIEGSTPEARDAVSEAIAAADPELGQPRTLGDYPLVITYADIRPLDQLRIWRPDGLSTEGVAWEDSSAWGGRATWRTPEGGALVAKDEPDAAVITLLHRPTFTEQPTALGTVVVATTHLNRELREFVRVLPQPDAPLAWLDTAPGNSRRADYAWPHLINPQVVRWPIRAADPLAIGAVIEALYVGPDEAPDYTTVVEQLRSLGVPVAGIDD